MRQPSASSRRLYTAQCLLGYWRNSVEPRPAIHDPYLRRKICGLPHSVCSRRLLLRKRCSALCQLNLRCSRLLQPFAAVCLGSLPHTSELVLTARSESRQLPKTTRPETNTPVLWPNWLHRHFAESIQSPYIYRASGLAQIAVPTPLRSMAKMTRTFSRGALSIRH
jgi:hypothetical protein